MFLALALLFAFLAKSWWVVIFIALHFIVHNCSDNCENCDPDDPENYDDTREGADEDDGDNNERNDVRSDHIRRARSNDF